MKLTLAIGCSILFVCHSSTIFSQTINNQVALQVGDSIPDTYFKNVINYTKDSLRLSEFRNKLLIIDFWNHRCGNCIAAFPRLDSLQKYFSGKIQIVMVNKESKESTISFFNKFKHIKMPNLPLITGDSILDHLFPHEAFPSHVWIDKSGRILHLTEGYNTTKENIEAYLSSNSVNIKNIQVERKKGSHMSHLYTDWSDVVYSYSSITKCRDSFNVGNETPSQIATGRLFRVSSTCTSILDLYLMAYNSTSNRPFGKKYNTRLEVSDSSKYIRPSNPNEWDRWLENNAYSYELILDSCHFKERFEYMQNDLKRAFNLEATIEKKFVKGFVLNTSRDLKNKNSKDSIHWDNYFDFISGKAECWIFNNIPVPSFTNRLRIKIEKSTPLICNIDSNLLISLCIPFNIWNAGDNFKELSKLLSRQGIELREELVGIDVLVIKEQHR